MRALRIAPWIVFVAALFIVEGGHGAWMDGSNPVFSPPGGAYYPSVLFDAASFSGHGSEYLYKMWYDDGAASAVGLAGSDDGLNWTVLSSGVSGLTNAHHVQVLYDAGGFGGSGYCYRIWYWNQSVVYGIGAIRTARSADGIGWTDDQAVAQVGTSVVTGVWPNWNYGSYGPIALLYKAGGSATLDDGDIFNNRYVMYYDGSTGGQEAWGLAYSTDGLLWKGYNGGTAPVLPPGGTGQWDANYAAHGAVVRNPWGTWDLWYGGGIGSSNQGIGHATSPDGIIWTRDPANPLTALGCSSPPSALGCAGSWNASRNYTPVVLAHPFGSDCAAPALKMWRTGAGAAGTKAVGYASLAASTLQVPADYPGIQAAIDAARPGDMVQVAAGTYAENLVIDRPIELAGAGEGATTVVPASSNPDCGGVGGSDPLCAGASHLVLVQADCVTIHDLTLDGDNPGLTSGVIRGGADLDARNGIILNFPLGPFDHLTVHHTTVKNVHLRGIYAYNPARGAIDFHHNTVDNVQGHNYYSIGIFSRHATGTVSDNTVSRCPDAISANWSHGLQFLRNTVTASGSGVHTDNAGSDAGDPSDLLEDNSVSGGVSFGGDPIYGVWAFNPYLAVSIRNNTVGGADIGLAAHRRAAPAGVVAFAGNSVDGSARAGSRGALVSTDGLGWGSGDVSATFSGDTLRFGATGLSVDQSAGGAAAAQVTGAVITGNGTGVLAIGGGSATVTLSDLSANTAYGVNNAGGIASALCNWWGSALGPAHIGNPGGTGSAVTDGVVYDPWNDTDKSGICNGCVVKPAAPAVTPAGPIPFCAGGPVSEFLTSTATTGSYQWYRDGLILPGAVSQTYAATAAGTYTVKVTVAGCASPASNAVLLTAIAAPPPITYVDDGYAGLAFGTAVDWPHTGSGGTHLIGCDAFATIQGGVGAVAAGGTVNVADGAYAENVVIPTPLTLAGHSRTGVVVVPALSAPNPCTGSSLCPGASNVILVQADNVVIHDLTIDGDNPLLASGIVRGGADIDARNGIITNHQAGSFTALEVHDVTVRNIYLRGMYASSGGTFNFHHNAVDNVQGDYYSIGIFAWYGPGVMADNAVSRCNDAVSANHSRGIQFLNNIVTLSGSGVHTDNAGDGGGAADLILNNTVINCTPGGYGIWTFVPYLAPTVEGNIVTNCDMGLSAWGQGAPVTQLFLRNIVTGSMAADSVGAYITTDWISWGYSDIAVRFEENALSGFETGIYLTADEQSWNPGPWASHAVSAVFYNNSLDGDLRMGTQGTYACDASANWWGTRDAAAVKARVNGGAVADYTPWFDAGTDTSADPGFQGDFTRLHVDDDSPQTGTTTRLQEGIDRILDGSPSADSTVAVEAGTYGGALNIDARQHLLVQGAGRDAVLFAPTAVLPWNVGGYGAARTAALRVVGSTDIGVSGLTFDFAAVSDNNVIGVLYWDSSGDHSANRYRSMGRTDRYYEITSYWRATGAPWSEDNRAPISITGSEFIDTGRLGLVTHDWVHATLTGNTFTKTIHDFGYAVEIGSTSTAVVSGNTISGFDTPATDHSQSGALYIENAFTAGVAAAVAKPVQVSNNVISGCQWGIYIGNEYDGYAGNVDIQVILSGNTVQNAAIAPVPFPGDPYGGIYITDEDRSAGSSVTVTGGGNIVRNNGQTGIIVAGWGDADITVALSGETVTGHARGVRASDPGGASAFSLAVTNSDLSGNSLFGVENTVAGVTFDARCDWWGTPTGPTHVGNPGGTGSPSSTGVSYSPWAGTNTFDCAVKYAVPTRLVYTQQPTDTVVDTAITPAVALRAEDGDGNLGYNFHGTLGALTMAIGANPAGGTLSGTAARQADHGTVAFGDLAIDRAGTAYSLIGTAGAPWTFAPESVPFNILLPLGEVIELYMNRNGADPALIDLRFTDVGNYNYNIYVSSSPATHPFDVTVAGRKDCAAAGVTPPSGGFRQVLGYDPGLAGEALYFLVTADFGKANSEGPLGVDSGGAFRSATAYCRLP